MAKADAAASRSKTVNSNTEEDAHDSEMDALPTPWERAEQLEGGPKQRQLSRLKQSQLHVALVGG